MNDTEHQKVDALERWMLENGELVDQPVFHEWATGLYIRTVFNPAGSLITTKIHKTRHPFFLMKGSVVARSGEGVAVKMDAPFAGITEPGTRRVIHALEDVLWVTVHALTPEEEAEPDIEKRLEMLEARIIERRELLPGRSAHELFAERYAARLTEGQS